MKNLGRYWGYLLFVLLLTAWWSREVGPVALIVLSGIVTLYFLFGAPRWCGAETRQNLRCRNNANGLLVGCHIREHKWQKIKMTFVTHRWRELNRGLWATPKECLATVGGVVAILSGIVATVQTLVQKLAA